MCPSRYVNLVAGSDDHSHTRTPIGCGYTTSSGYTAAINQLSFGAPGGVGPGDACGRCFALTADQDPYSPSYAGPFGPTIIVKVTDLCPVQGNQEWCGQSLSHPTNQHGAPVQYVSYTEIQPICPA